MRWQSATLPNFTTRNKHERKSDDNFDKLNDQFSSVRLIVATGKSERPSRLTTSPRARHGTQHLCSTLLAAVGQQNLIPQF
jgi:hypothetical protein